MFHTHRTPPTNRPIDHRPTPTDNPADGPLPHPQDLRSHPHSRTASLSESKQGPDQSPCPWTPGPGGGLHLINGRRGVRSSSLVPDSSHGNAWRPGVSTPEGQFHTAFRPRRLNRSGTYVSCRGGLATMPRWTRGAGVAHDAQLGASALALLPARVTPTNGNMACA